VRVEPFGLPLKSIELTSGHVKDVVKNSVGDT